MKPVLILTVGLPRSGKSSAARCSGFPVVCPDAIRLALHRQPFVATAEPFVWATAKLMVASLFGAGHQKVVLDACNGTRNRRDEWEDPRWDRHFCVFAASAEECIQRAHETDREDLISVIERMAAAWEPIGADENGAVTFVPLDWPPQLLLV